MVLCETKVKTCTSQHAQLFTAPCLKVVGELSGVETFFQCTSRGLPQAGRLSDMCSSVHEGKEIRRCSNAKFSNGLKKGQHHLTKPVANSTLEWILRVAEVDRLPCQQGAQTTVVCRIRPYTVAGPIFHLSTLHVGAMASVQVPSCLDQRLHEFCGSS